MKNRFFKLFLLWMTSLTFVACSTNTQQGTTTTTAKVEKSHDLPESLLPFKKEKQLVLGELDSYKRSTQAHIQLRYDDKPTEQRESKINVDPVGWHNFKFPIDYSGKEAWFMNRGHLVGYQFSGLNDELRNLTPMTAYLNTGSMTGTDEKNPAGMLFYEEKLAAWLKQNKNAWLDYRVTPLYTDSELIPRQVELQYAGISANGRLIPIQFNTSIEEVNEDGTTRVILNNDAPNGTLDYQTGLAEPTITSEHQETTQSAAKSKNDRTVYVANEGKATVYWYDKKNMPAKTNQAKVVEMSESQAKAQGKTHAGKE
ncbi:DNA/RNA non-specific endonuclease [uncultured Granulicatella sp.]|uniref:DNA/RNA non-specific endonuclease n=1 Tax=uncultured Granulicatella sp. TaxID=316089 RepID=UPI0028DB23BB|nr:DNA/RNA non-specific endonuclease [uncultured Granulicatella sp.]